MSFRNFRYQFQLFTFLRRDQVNLLVYQPTDPIFNKNKKIILQNFGQLAFFKSIIFCLLKKNKKQKTEETCINNLNQGALIVIIINHKLRVSLLCLLCKILFSKKYQPWELNNIICILPADRPNFFCCLTRRPKI